jgi:hypothetical protein
MMGGMSPGPRRPTTGPVIRQRRSPVTFRGRLCGRCLTVSWHPDSVRAGWCTTCGQPTAGQPVSLPERIADPHAADLLHAVRALATP